MIASSVIAQVPAGPHQREGNAEQKMSAFEQFKQFRGISTVVPNGDLTAATDVRMPHILSSRVSRIPAAKPSGESRPVRFGATQEFGKPTNVVEACAELPLSQSDANTNSKSNDMEAPSLISVPGSRRQETDECGPRQVASASSRMDAVERERVKLTIEFDTDPVPIDRRVAPVPSTSAPWADRSSLSDTVAERPSTLPLPIAADIPASRNWESQFEEQQPDVSAAPASIRRVQWESSTAIPPYWREVDEIVATGRSRETVRARVR